MAEIQTQLLLDELKKYFEAGEWQAQFAELADKSIAEKAGWAFSVGIPLVAGIIEKIVKDLDYVGTDAGSVKKDALVKFLDDLIKLPALLEPFDGMVISWAVDKLIERWNSLHGHDWFEKIKDTLGIA